MSTKKCLESFSICRFKKWKLNLDSVKPPAVTIKPSLSLSTDLTINDLTGQVKHHATFNAQPKAVAKVLDETNIVMEVWRVSNVGRPDEKIGQAGISLTSLKNTSESRVARAAVMDEDNLQVVG